MKIIEMNCFAPHSGNTMGSPYRPTELIGRDSTPSMSVIPKTANLSYLTSEGQL